MDQGVALGCLCCNKLVDPGFDAMNIFSVGSSCEPTEGGSLERQQAPFASCTGLQLVGV